MKDIEGSLRIIRGSTTALAITTPLALKYPNPDIFPKIHTILIQS